MRQPAEALPCAEPVFGPAPRRNTRQVLVGGVAVGGDAPVVVQSMTNTDTADVAATTKQVSELWRAGSELVRVTVNTPEAAAGVPRIVEKLAMMGIEVPIIGDFHYNGHQLLANEPACAEALAKYRINPGNVGFGKKKDVQFAQLIEFAIRHGKPMRTGLPYWIANAMSCANCTSFFLPKPTLPGLMRYLASASAQAGSPVRS